MWGWFLKLLGHQIQDAIEFDMTEPMKDPDYDWVMDVQNIAVVDFGIFVAEGDERGKQKILSLCPHTSTPSGDDGSDISEKGLLSSVVDVKDEDEDLSVVSVFITGKFDTGKTSLLELLCGRRMDGRGESVRTRAIAVKVSKPANANEAVLYVDTAGSARVAENDFASELGNEKKVTDAFVRDASFANADVVIVVLDRYQQSDQDDFIEICKFFKNQALDLDRLDRPSPKIIAIHNRRTISNVSDADKEFDVLASSAGMEETVRRPGGDMGQYLVQRVEGMQISHVFTCQFDSEAGKVWNEPSLNNVRSWIQNANKRKIDFFSRFMDSTFGISRESDSSSRNSSVVEWRGNVFKSYVRCETDSVRLVAAQDPIFKNAPYPEKQLIPGYELVARIIRGSCVTMPDLKIGLTAHFAKGAGGGGLVHFDLGMNLYLVDDEDLKSSKKKEIAEGDRTTYVVFEFDLSQIVSFLDLTKDSPQDPEWKATLKRNADIRQHGGRNNWAVLESLDFGKYFLLRVSRSSPHACAVVRNRPSGIFERKFSFPGREGKSYKLRATRYQNGILFVEGHELDHNKVEFLSPNARVLIEDERQNLLDTVMVTDSSTPREDAEKMFGRADSFNIVALEDYATVVTKESSSPGDDGDDGATVSAPDEGIEQCKKKLDALMKGKDEIERKLKKTYLEFAEDDMRRLRNETADPLPFSAGERQGSPKEEEEIENGMKKKSPADGVERIEANMDVIASTIDD